jgi:hypothetical protein
VLRSLPVSPGKDEHQPACGIGWLERAVIAKPEELILPLVAVLENVCALRKSERRNYRQPRFNFDARPIMEGKHRNRREVALEEKLDLLILIQIKVVIHTPVFMVEAQLQPELVWNGGVFRNPQGELKKESQTDRALEVRRLATT